MQGSDSAVPQCATAMQPGCSCAGRACAGYEHTGGEGARSADTFGCICHAPYLPGPRIPQEEQVIINLIDLCLSVIQVAFTLVLLNLAFSFSFEATQISPSRESKLLNLSSGSKCLHSMNRIYCPLCNLLWWL